MNICPVVTSLFVFRYCCGLHYFLTIPLSFNFTFHLFSSSVYKRFVTYGPKTQSSLIEIHTVCRRSVVQHHWLMATFISIQCPSNFIVFYRFVIAVFVSPFLQNRVGFLGEKAIDKDAKMYGKLVSVVSAASVVKEPLLQ